MALEIRAITPDELDDLILADHRAFGAGPRRPNEPRTWAEGELDRTRVAFEDGGIVGASRAYSFELTLPGGGIVPAAAVSWVGVLPTHRRRGVLTRMMDALHEDARTRDEPAMILTASESVIYGRYGYGVATWRLGLSVERAQAAFLRPVDDRGRVRLVTREEAEKILPSVYDQIRRGRAGMVSRPDYWWPEVFWGEHGEPGKALFVVLHEDASGIADGFAEYEITGDWTGGHSKRRVIAYDVQATNPTARAALWQYLLGIDLVVGVSSPNLPIDEPLRHLLRDPRQARVDYINDGLWLAPLDAKTLLAARRYSVFDGHLVLEVRGLDGTTTTLAVDGNDRDAHCAETNDTPDLSCSSAVLGAMLLGGNRWTEYAAAGLVEERTPGKLQYADAMFVISPPPTLCTPF
jgi:predicted acetyltransferase